MAEKSAETDRSNSLDRISQLPEDILRHILCVLSQDEAVFPDEVARTSVLSKKWRHIWCTRSRFDFYEGLFKGGSKEFVSTLDKYLQGYHDRKLSIREFVVCISLESVSLLEKWIPPLILNMGVEKFYLYLINNDDDKDHPVYDLPSVVFEAEFLKILILHHCKLSPDKVLCKNLTRLGLARVHVLEETLHKIISSCPLIEEVSLDSCEGLRTIDLNQKLQNLKKFSFCQSYKEDCDESIEIHLPTTLEYIFIYGDVNWFQDIKFPNLKSLHLCDLRLSSKLFDNFSCNFPVLENLTLSGCNGLKELNLLSHSIKHLSVECHRYSIMTAVIDAPNILQFEYSGFCCPSISFATTSTKWKSEISLSFNVDLDDHDGSSIWFLKLSGMLMALIQCEVFLVLNRSTYHIEDPLDNGGGVFYIPQVVEHLLLNGFSSPFSLNGLFRVCRPKIIGNMHYYPNEDFNELIMSLCKILLSQNEELEKNSWQQDLEGVSIEEKGEDGWHHVRRITNLSECDFPNNKKHEENQLRLRLKWRETSYIS